MTASTIINEARTYTGNMLTLASDAVDTAVSSAQAVGYTIPNYLAATLPTAPPSAISYSLPTFSDVTFDLPAEPASNVVFQDISPVDAGTSPTLTAATPTLTLPTAPAQLAALQAQMPGLTTSFAFPDPPAALTTPLLDAPSLVTRAEPNAPTTNLPGFTAVAPTDTSVAPTNIDQTMANSYATAAPSTIAMMDGYVDAMIAKYNPQFATQMSAIETQLSRYLQGGTGLNSAAETAIYERSRAKQEAETSRVRDGALRDLADRGFTLPTGALFNAMQMARQSGADNNAQASREIVVMQAEMEQKNLQFAVTTSMELRKVLISASLSYHQNLTTINGQALQYAKMIADGLIETYNTAVKAFSAKLDAYRAEAVVYDTKLKAALAGMELYRMEIQALEAMTNVDRTRVDVYRARIESLSSLSNVYRAQIDAVQGRVGLEKLKLDVFQAQVQSYTAQVQAKNAEWAGYSAAIEGEHAKVRLYSTQVEGYNAQVNGYKALIEAKSEVIRSTATSNQAKAEQYRALMAGYQTVVTARGEKAKTQLENQRQTVLAFQAQVGAQVSNAQVQQEYYKAVSNVAIQNADGKLKAQLGELDSRRSYGQTIAQLNLANAEVYGRMASSALAGMTTLAAEQVFF